MTRDLNEKLVMLTKSKLENKKLVDCFLGEVGWNKPEETSRKRRRDRSRHIGRERDRLAERKGD